MRHRFSWLLAIVLVSSVAAEEPTSVNAVPSRPRLVIIGASYAADWKRPALPGYTVINRGIGGQDTGDMLARFESDVVAAKPSAVLIWGLINNVHRAPEGGMEAAKKRVQEDYRQMISLARTHGITVFLATEITLSEAVGWKNRLAAVIGHLRGKQGYSFRVNQEVRALNAWLRAQARAQGLHVLDFEKAFDDGEGFRKLEYSTSDGTHITHEGYAELTRYASAQLRSAPTAAGR